MKKYLLIFWLLVCAPFWVFSQSDEGYYVPLDDISGIDTTQHHTDLETATEEIVLSIADTLFHSQFRVYDFGFYIHNEVTAEGVQEAWNQSINNVNQGALSDYFVLFGRESNSSGINKRIRVELRLPNTQNYSCLNESSLRRLMEEVANENLPSGYVRAEIEALKVLKDYIYKVIVCNCANTGPECNQFSGFRYIDLELRGLGFRKKQIELGAPASWPNGTLGIYDHVGAKVIIDGEEYYIPEEVAESKAIFDSPTQVFEDTVINTSVTGEVYILNNESFTNGEWENAVAQSTTVDYVEYWVVLTDDEGNTFLYSKYTLGALEDTPAARDENGEANRPSVTVSPWGAALKVLGNAAIDACMQAVVIFLLDTEVNHDFLLAWKKVNYLGSVWEGLTSLLPWKKSIKETLVYIATKGFVSVVNNALTKPNYTVSQGISDFIQSCGSDLLTEIVKHPRAAYHINNINSTASKLLYSQALGRLFRRPSMPALFKKIIAKATYHFSNNIIREIGWIPATTKKIYGVLGKTTTIVGKEDSEIMVHIRKQVFPHELNVRQVYGYKDANSGGVNVFYHTGNNDNETFIAAIKWIRNAVDGGDNIFLATIPNFKSELIGPNYVLKNNLARHLHYLVTHEYKPSNLSNHKWREIQSWF